MKVSCFVHDLSSNPIVRAYPIIKAIQKLGFEVEVLGLTYNTDEIYEPYKDKFNYITIRSYLDIRWVIKNSIKLSKLATGDIIYSFKPVWGALFPALLASKFGFKKKLLLDAEDNELYDAFIGNGVKNLFKNKWYPLNPFYNKILHPFTLCAKERTIVCTSLQKRYGGTIILHGPDPKIFDPNSIPESQEELRKKFNIPPKEPTLLFAGRPVYYNGLEFVINALLLNKTFNWHLVLAGNPNSELFQMAKNKLGERCHLLGFIPNNEMPQLLKAIDVVPIIQSSVPSAEMQIPAKLLEAMSMKKAVIGTPVADIPLILGKDNVNKNGWIVERSLEAFANTLHEIYIDKKELILRGENARNYFLENASIDIISKRLKPLLMKEFLNKV